MRRINSTIFNNTQPEPGCPARKSFTIGFLESAHCFARPSPPEDFRMDELRTLGSSSSGGRRKPNKLELKSPRAAKLAEIVLKRSN